MLVLITGGARSGKSRFAEQYAARLGNRGYYVATSRIWDEEMRHRVELHRSERAASGFQWVTVEEPLKLAELLDRLGSTKGCSGRPVILVDCLTLWLTNVLFAAEPDMEAWDSAAMARGAKLADEEAGRLVDALRRLELPVLLVTNEVGDGIVPDYPLGRVFRDAAGKMNQRIADVSDQVFLVTAGIPVDLKRLAFQLPPLFEN